MRAAPDAFDQPSEHSRAPVLAARDVPATLAVEGDQVVVEVDHAGGDWSYPIHATTVWTMSDPPLPTPGHSCNERWTDDRFVFDIHTMDAPKGPSVRWLMHMTPALTATLSAAGHLSARMNGKNWVQSPRTRSLVPQGGPSKRGVPLSYKLHSSIYNVQGVGHRQLKWGQYVQINVSVKSRGARGTYFGKLAWTCEPQKP